MPRWVQIETCFFWDDSLYMHNIYSRRAGPGPDPQAAGQHGNIIYIRLHSLLHNILRGPSELSCCFKLKFLAKL